MTHAQKVKLEVPLLLPDVPDVKDRCVATLIETLSARDGIKEAHVVDDAAGTPILCVHYDPDVITLSRVRELAQSTGAELTDRIGHLVAWTAETLHARAARSLSSKIEALGGVIEAGVGASGAVRIEFDRKMVSESELRRRVAGLGVHLAKESGKTHDSHEGRERKHQHEREHKDAPGHEHGASDDGATDKSGHEGHEGHDHGHGGPFGEKSELIFSLICGILLAAGWVLTWRQLGPQWLSTACYVAAYGFGGFFTLREAIDNLRAKRFEIDTLMLVAAVGAAALGKWAEGALLLFLFSLGHSLEHYAMGRARRAIEALAQLAPERAVVRRNGSTVEVSVSELSVGEVVIVRPNERLPADGFVIQGTTSVNQAPVTGESVPVEKRPVEDPKAALAQFERLGSEYRVFAGTINGAGAFEMTVARRSDQSTTARVVKMVAEAEAQRSPTQQFTERFERLFVPAVLVLVGVLLFAWVVVDEPFATSFYRAMAVLVAASPCALAISVPSAVLSGVARAARGGVLVKGGGPLENLGTLTSIAFDKTGTLTEGKPRLTDVVAAPESSE